MTSYDSHIQSEIYFLHGTSIDSRVWHPSVVHAIANAFDDSSKQGFTRLFDWSGANNSQARKKAGEDLLREVDQRKREQACWPPKIITFVGHSHGGSVVLYASQALRGIIGVETQINILTLNTPNVVGGAQLEDDSIHHYHVYCSSDEVAPRGGFNRTGRLSTGGAQTNWFGKPIGGEYSSKKDLGSGKEGSVYWEFDSARINIDYRDQYRFKGLNPRTHWVSHRGWLKKNVREWLPSLAEQMRLLADPVAR
ncbi:MAG: hypothetical protein AAF587_31390 [Bacteroidota bacterium]